MDFITLRLLGRRFSADERAVAGRTLDAALTVYRTDAVAAGRLLSVGDSPMPVGLAAPEVAAWTLVASKILNLDESLTK